MVSYATVCDCNTDTHLCRTTTSMCYGEEHIPHAQQFIWYKHVRYISVHATMKQLNSLTQVNLTTLLGQTLHFIGFEELSPVGHKLQQTTSDDPGRQHTLWSTHIVLFLHTAPSRKQEASNSSMAFLCCSQKWSGALLHMKWGRHSVIWWNWHIYCVPNELVCLHMQTRKGVTLMIHTIQRFTELQVSTSVPMHKTHIRQAANIDITP